MAKAVIKPAGLGVTEHLVRAAGTAAGVERIPGGTLGMGAQVLGAGGQAQPVGVGVSPVPEAQGKETPCQGEQGEQPEEIHVGLHIDPKGRAIRLVCGSGLAMGPLSEDGAAAKQHLAA